MFIFDAHLDLAMNALEWNRDLTCTISEIRARELGMNDNRTGPKIRCRWMPCEKEILDFVLPLK